MSHDIRQSPDFANFMEKLNWKVDKIEKNYIYLKKFPLFGYFAKLPRINIPIPLAKINKYIKKNNIFILKISPNVFSSDKQSLYLKNELSKNGFIIEKNPFNPTTTIHIDLTKNETDLFNNLIQAKRRAIRKAVKNKIFVKESTDISEFINIRKQQYFPFSFLIDSETEILWNTFFPQNASLLLAYQYCGKKPLAGILLIFYKRIAYYWFASSTKIGKKMYAPSLLVWEALKLSKNRGCDRFDFEGIYDERFPKASSSWRGFTKFKEGFGGKKIQYLENFTTRFLFHLFK